MTHYLTSDSKVPKTFVSHLPIFFSMEGQSHQLPRSSNVNLSPWLECKLKIVNLGAVHSILGEEGSKQKTLALHLWGNEGMSKKNKMQSRLIFDEYENRII